MTFASAPLAHAQPAPIHHNERYSVTEACSRLRIGRAKLYEDIKQGKIKIIKDGSRTFIPGSEIIRLSTLPDEQPSASQRVA